MAGRPLLWICGATCVGKSTVGWELFLQIMRSGTKAGYVDVGQLGFCRPVSRHDPAIRRLQQRNLEAVWENFRAAGAECFIVAGSVRSYEDFERYVEPLTETEPTLCRLQAGESRLRERVFSRGRGIAPSLPGDEIKGRPIGDLRRIAREAAEEAEELERIGLGDVHIDTDDQSISALAMRIRRRTVGMQLDRRADCEPVEEI